MSQKNSYRLINPYIEGTVDTTVRASNPFSAGKKLYNTISNYFTNHVEDFYMTVQNMETKGLTHFKIGEKRHGNDSVDFNLSRLEKSLGSDLESNLVNSVDKLNKQSGGRMVDPDDTTTTDSSEYYDIPVLPISRFVYYYLPYYKLNVVGVNPIYLNRIFIPTFNFPVNPTVEVRFDLYKF